jgi:hypothetical protein
MQETPPFDAGPQGPAARADEKTRFQPGNPGGPGRPKRTPTPAASLTELTNLARTIAQELPWPTTTTPAFSEDQLAALRPLLAVHTARKCELLLAIDLAAAELTLQLLQAQLQQIRTTNPAGSSPSPPTSTSAS